MDNLTLDRRSPLRNDFLWPAALERRIASFAVAHTPSETRGFIQKEHERVLTAPVASAAARHGALDTLDALLLQYTEV